MTRREQIAEEALALPAEDRAYVAELIEQSLISEEFASDGITDAWSAEINRRIAAYDRGETQAVDFETASENMRMALATHRQQQDQR